MARLDIATRTTGRHGIAAARAALLEARKAADAAAAAAAREAASVSPRSAA